MTYRVEASLNKLATGDYILPEPFVTDVDDNERRWRPLREDRQSLPRNGNFLLKLL